MAALQNGSCQNGNGIAPKGDSCLRQVLPTLNIAPVRTLGHARQMMIKC
jgi:hypothetical protein